MSGRRGKGGGAGAGGPPEGPGRRGAGAGSGGALSLRIIRSGSFQKYFGVSVQQY